MKILAVIPARGGSKSIPMKNVRPFNGHPLIAYSIAAASQSRNIDRTICSTDDQNIASIAEQYGSEIPFLRPADLADDDTRDFPVLVHALYELGKAGEEYDAVVHLRPTCPLRPEGLIDQAIEILKSRPEVDCVRSVSVPSENPFKMWQERNDLIEPFVASSIEEAYNAPRQSLPEVFWHNGLVDVIRTQCLLEKGSVTGNKIAPIFTHPSYRIDLDNEWQWQHAELWYARIPMSKVEIK
ncbi:MAG: acylneuraminate cytidylyltransferase family protein [Saprospiraceae bacterium]|nr:acylneuraminate cytidylyltransferase family protein [Saprospiraceae bacterium]